YSIPAIESGVPDRAARSLRNPEDPDVRRVIDARAIAAPRRILRMFSRHNFCTHAGEFPGSWCERREVAMTMVLMRTMQLLVLAGIVMLLPAKRAEANDIVCYAICAYDDWQCIFETGHPADPCAYDSS